MDVVGRQHGTACPSCEATDVEAAEALAAMDIGEAESHPPTLRIMHECGHRDRVVADIVSSHEGTVIDLTFTGTLRVTGSDKEE
ncbi:putative methyltransferase PMT17 [Hordeum vulgare]|nr:putative methyltransferase PMT17 [Hordeum vulgare]